MTTQVVDTNVLLVANHQHPDVSDACVVACARRLRDLMADGRIAIDDAYAILREYQHKTHPRAARGMGDVFLKWVLQNQANPARCDRVALAPDAERGFASFPDDPRLADFDPSDRKFVAVAMAHPSKPPIVQAADSKWLGWQPALAAHGVAVDFVCPTDIHAFDTQKRRRKSRVR